MTRLAIVQIVDAATPDAEEVGAARIVRHVVQLGERNLQESRQALYRGCDEALTLFHGDKPGSRDHRQKGRDV